MALSVRRSRLIRVVFGVVSLLPLVQACGSRSSVDDYAAGEDGAMSSGASAGAEGGTGTGGSHAMGGANVGGSVIIGGTTGVAGRSGAGGKAAGGNTGAGGRGRGGTTGRGGAGSGGTGIGGTIVGGAPDGGASPGPTISCGAQTCDASTQTCCVGLTGLSCIANNKTCNGVPFGCTNSADCDGNGVCCLSVAGGVMISSSCEASCNGAGPNGGLQLCASDAECAPPNRNCRQTPLGLGFCAPGRRGRGFN